MRTLLGLDSEYKHFVCYVKQNVCIRNRKLILGNKKPAEAGLIIDVVSGALCCIQQAAKRFFNEGFLNPNFIVPPIALNLFCFAGA